jgi:Holliday junction resolvasome RuvABC ATP-dependent DNA helicase subunit
MPQNNERIWQNQIDWFPKDQSDLAPSKELRKAWCDPAWDTNPFHNFIGNEHAVRRLCRAAFKAMERYNRLCNDHAFALLGPSSTGKTTLARMFGKLIDLPFVEISAPSISSVTDIAAKIAEVCENTFVPDGNGNNHSLELEEMGEGTRQFLIPPLIVFIDEVHALPKKVEQGLLKAIAPNDHMLETEGGYHFNTINVCWLIATTDRGSLANAFDNRFSKIHLNLYSLDEIAQIVGVHNPDWDSNVCQLVAKFGGHVPREALAFAKEMLLENEMHGGTWEEVVDIVAEENGIDKFGMTIQRLAILTALGQGAISKARLGGIANCEEAELNRFIMPALLASTSDQQPLVRVTGRGFAITKEGVAELDRRGISYAPDLFVRKSSLRNRLGRNREN